MDNYVCESNITEVAYIILVAKYNLEDDETVSVRYQLILSKIGRENH